MNLHLVLLFVVTSPIKLNDVKKKYEKENDPKVSFEKSEKRLFESNEFEITDVSNTNPKDNIPLNHDTKKSFDCKQCEYSTLVKRNLTKHIPSIIQNKDLIALNVDILHQHGNT